MTKVLLVLAGLVLAILGLVYTAGIILLRLISQPGIIDRIGLAIALGLLLVVLGSLVLILKDAFK